MRIAGHAHRRNSAPAFQGARMSDHDTNQREKLWDLIKDMRFGMFTTRHDNGHLHSRPMTTQNKAIDEDDSLWFFMSRSGDPVHDIEQSEEVNVTYADPGKDAYVSVSGKARLVEDMAVKRRLWSKLNEAYFKDGVEDPDCALVRVRISHANYWDVKSSKLVQLWDMARAAVTGQPVKHRGDHGEVRMH
jgi:general stress protein 26